MSWQFCRKRMLVSVDCYCFSSRKSSEALCTHLLVAIVSASRNQARLCTSIFWLLLVQQCELERCSVHASSDCYCFSSLKSSHALCRHPLTAIVSAVLRRAMLCADIFWLLLLQQPEVERAFVTASSRCYCFSSSKTTDTPCLPEVERAFVPASSRCYCFSSSKASGPLC